jgi:hypothetical protein
MSIESVPAKSAFQSRLAARIERMIQVQSVHPIDPRRGRLLAIFILIVGVILTYTTIESALIAVIYQSAEYLEYITQNIVVLIVVYVFWRANRIGKTRVVACVFFGFLILFAYFYTTPDYFDYLMVFFAVVDVYDALTSARPYREAWRKERVLEHIRQESGKYFDPQIVTFFTQEIGKGI